MKKALILFGMVICSLSTRGQMNLAGFNRYKEINSKADSLFELNIFKEAAIYYDEAYKIFKGQGPFFDDYKAGFAALKSGNTKMAKKYFLDISINSRFTCNDKSVFLKRMIEKPDYAEFRESKTFKKIEDQLNLEVVNCKSSFNQEMAVILKDIVSLDQQKRSQLDTYYKLYGRESREVKDIWHDILLQDSINLNTVTGFLEKYGWQGPEVIGDDGSEALFLVIQHTDKTDIQKKYLQSLRKAVENASTPFWHYAYLLDRVNVASGKKQVYGSQFYFDSTKKESVLYPVYQPKKLNSRRISKGLDPIELYAKQAGFRIDDPE